MKSFDQTIESMLLYLTQVEGTLILFGVTDDTVLRDHVVETLRRRLPEQFELLEFRYDPKQPQNISLLEGASAAASAANGHRLAVSVSGLETLPLDKQSEAIKLLNSQRNQLGRTGLAVILWLNRALFAKVAQKAADFYSWRSSTFFIEPPSDWSEADRLESQRRSYLEAIRHQNEYVNMAGLAPMRGGQVVQMRMEEIFIPLRVEQEVKIDLELKLIRFRGSILREDGSVIPDDLNADTGDLPYLPSSSLRGALRQVAEAIRETTTRRAELSDLLKESRAVVLGDPGAGKTTMLRYVAYQVASGILNPEEGRAGMPALPLALPAEIADCLPVYVRIGLYAQHLLSHPDATIAEFSPKQNAQLPLTEELLRHEMERGKVLFLLDGLDEIVETAQRQDVARRVDEFARNHPQCPVIVTSRIVGYRESQLGSAFGPFTIRPFDDREVRRFVEDWYRALEMPGQADSLVNSIEASDSIRKLASNPLLLTVIALIHLRNVKLPNRRVELYQKAAETLVDNWMTARRVVPDDWDSEETLHDLLPAIAWTLHQQTSGGLIAQDDLHALLVQTMRERNPRLTEDEAHRRAAQFRRNVAEFSGIFLERGLDEAGRGLYGFLHLTFEEYFAAVRLKDKWKREGFKTLKPLLHHPRWNEVILLAAGTMDQFDASRFVETILGARSQYESILHRDLLLAARVLADDVRVDPPLRQQVVANLANLYFADSTPGALAEDIRKTFAGLAGSLAHEDVEDVLLNRSSDNEPSLRSAAASALGALGERAAGEEVIEKLFGLLADTDESVRSAAADALGALGERAASEAVIEKLLALLSDTDGDVRSAVAIALGAIGERAASEAVIEKLLALLSDTDGDVRSAAARALGSLGERAASEAVIEKLLALLSDTEWSVQSVAAVALGAIGKWAASEGVIKKLLGLLADTEWSVRDAAAIALGVMGERAASEGVIEKLLGLLADPESSVRDAVARALGSLGERAASEGVIEKLLGLLADPEWSVRDAAASALGKLSSKTVPAKREGGAARALPYARKRGKSEQARDQRNAGYIVLRNVMAAGVE
jgi:HEAT repeat protein